MNVSRTEWNALMSMFRNSENGQMAKELFEQWLDERYYDVYKQGWRDACDEYEIEEDGTYTAVVEEIAKSYLKK